MRTMIGKRIGPVPIALVAVLALAAFISAGLWLVPSNGAQAQSAVGSPGAMTVDVGESFSAPVTTWFSGLPDGALAGEFTTYTPDGDDPDTIPEAFTGRTIEATGTPPVITISMTGAEIDTALGTDDSTGDLRIIVGYDAPDPDGGGDMPDPPIVYSNAYTLTVEQNPVESDGVMFTTPQTVFADHDTDPETPNVRDSMAWRTATETDDSCKVSYDATDVLARGVALNTVAAADPDPALTNRLVTGGDCVTTGDSIDVTIQNAEAGGTENLFIVYVSGGDKFKKVAPHQLPPGGPGGYNEHIFTLDGASTVAGDEVFGEETITVTRSMAGDAGAVLLIGYVDTAETDGTGATADNNLGDDDTTFGGNAAFVIKTLFLNAPVNVKDDDDMTGSMLMTDLGAEDFDNDDNMVTVTAVVEDAQGHPLGNGTVTFNVEYDEGVHAEGRPRNVLQHPRGRGWTGCRQCRRGDAGT